MTGAGACWSSRPTVDGSRGGRLASLRWWWLHSWIFGWWLEPLSGSWNRYYTSIQVIWATERAFFFRYIVSYLNFRTYSLFTFLICSLHLGLFLLLTTIHSLFLQLIFSLFLSLSFPKFFRSSCSFFCVSAINILSSAYLLLRLCPLKVNNSRTFRYLSITLLKRLNKSGEKTHPCLSSLAICKYLLKLFFWL